MSPRQHVEGLIFLTFLLFASSHGYALTDDEVPPGYIIRGGDDIIPSIGLLSREQNYVIDPEQKPNLEVRFPKLSIKQRKFAVNPGYMSYYNPDFEGIEDDRDKLEQSVQNEDQEAQDIIKQKDDNLETAENLIRLPPLLPPTDDDMGEIVETADEYALEPVDSKKASAYSVVPEIRLEAMAEESRVNDIYFTTIVAVSSAVAVFAIVGAGLCYHRLQKNAKATEDVEYPAYGVTGPGKDISPTASGGDRKLAQNAQMYHYQHQKQQMIAFDNSHQTNGNRGGALVSDDESDEGEEGDYTVYECPGLATTGEMEVRNPLFTEDQTPKASSMPSTQSSQ